MLGVAELATSKYYVDIDGVEVSSGVRWVGGVAWTYVRHIVQVHLGDVRWGDGVYFGWSCRGGKPWVFGGSHL